MKTNKLFMVTAALVAASPLFAAERAVEISELPPAARKALDDSSRGETIKKIAVRNAGGRTVYDVEFARENAPGHRLRIAEDGKILGDTRKAAASGTETPVVPLGVPGAGAYQTGYPNEPYIAPPVPKLRIEDLPQPVQKTIRSEAADREIAAIHETALDGRKAYVAQFSESGRNPRVYVAEDGQVLRPTEKPPVLLVGTTLSDTPAAVQQAVRRELSEGEIVHVDKEKESRGETEIYKIEVKDARGSYQLRVSPEGRVLENPRRASLGTRN
jgi:hypothetical protein